MKRREGPMIGYATHEYPDVTECKRLETAVVNISKQPSDSKHSVESKSKATQKQQRAQTVTIGVC